MRELETARLNLRRIRFDDLYDYYEHIGSDGEVTRYLNIEPHQDISESIASIENILEGYEEGLYCWAVALKDDDSLIGRIDLVDFEAEEESCSFVCILGKAWWNQGYAAEAMTAVLRFATEELGVRKIVADHMAPNAAAGAVMRRAGMVMVGEVAGKYEKQGQIYDAVCYELALAPEEPLTADEYQKKAMQTLNPGLSKGDILINGVMGLCGESGECIDLVKKHLHQGHELDRAKLAKELGDVAWYLAETAWALDLSLEEILRGNLDKLKKRYPQGFRAEQSINR